MRNIMLTFVLLAALLTVAPAATQEPTNPPLAPCDFPAQGRIVATVTYTLSADCTLTGNLTKKSPISVTINGEGHTIFYPSGTKSLLEDESGATCSESVINLKELTIDAGGRARGSPLASVFSICGTLVADTVTFRGSYGVFLSVQESGRVELSNTLFEDNFHTGLGNQETNNASAMLITGSATLKDVALRGNRYSAAAIRVRRAQDAGEDTAKLTTTGCLWTAGNIPLSIDDTYGDWTDTSVPCAVGKEIGNGATVRPEPQPSSCGLPLGGLPDSGNLIASRVYNLTADCDLLGSLYISEDLQVTINGNGRTISTDVNAQIDLARNASLTINNVHLDGLRIFNFGDMELNKISHSNATNNGIIDFGEMTICNALIDNNREPAVFAYWPYGAGNTIITDSVIRNTDAQRTDRAALYALGSFGSSGLGSEPSITLEGRVTFENNKPRDTRAVGGATIIDNRDNRDDSACPESVRVGPDPPPPDPKPTSDATDDDDDDDDDDGADDDDDDDDDDDGTESTEISPTPPHTPTPQRTPTPPPHTPTPTPTPMEPPHTFIPDEHSIVQTAHDDLQYEPVDIITLDKHPAIRGVRFAVRLWRFSPQCVHRVAAGDNLFRLAIQYQMTVEAFRSLNGIAGDHLRIGQNLLLPSCVQDGSLAFENTRICFEIPGNPVFIDTSMSPPQVSALEKFLVGGMTCAKVDRPGLVVLTAADF